MVFTRSQLDSLLRTGALPPAAQPTKADPPRLYSRSGMSAGCVFTRSLGDRGALSGSGVELRMGVDSRAASRAEQSAWMSHSDRRQWPHRSTL